MEASPELRVMLDPVGEYRRLADGRSEVAWTRALARPLLVAVMIGAAVSVLCTGLLTPALWFGSAVCWAFVPVIQVLTGLAFFGGRSPRALSVPRRLELLFLAHLPWTLWVLAIAAATLAWPRMGLLPIEISAVVFAGWTMRILAAFCVEVLGLDRSRGRWRVALHQLFTYVVVLAYIQAASQLVPRVIAVFQR